MLNTVRYGPESGQPLVIAHGLFGSARNWGAISRRLSESRPVIAVDMRNHATSPWFDSQSYADMAADLSGVIQAAGGRADLLGHSMGGKAAMVLALTRPEVIDHLIVADIAPVAYGHTLSHLIKAMRAVDLSAVTTRRDADEQLRQHVADDATRAFLLQSLDLKSSPPRWRLNLDVLDAEMDRITGFPEIGGRFDGPTLFVTGQNSDYVRPEHRPRILELFPNAQFVEIPDAGHWLHAQQPRAFISAVQGFLGG